MAYGIGTLHLFGINCSSSDTEYTNFYPSNHNFDSDSDTDVNEYDGYKTNYYTSNDIFCGSSVTTGINYSSGTFDKWKTKYYDSDGNDCGSSMTEGESYSRGNYSIWNTIYYNSYGVSCGKSKSEGNNYHAGSYCNWNTTYYNFKDIECGSSDSQEVNNCQSNYNSWKTIYNNCEEITDSLLHIPISSKIENVYDNEQKLKLKLILKSKPILKKNTNIDIKQFICQAKVYYISQSGCINASSSIFPKNITNSNLSIAYEKVISILRSRAKQNPGGASHKTLTYFGLKAD